MSSLLRGCLLQSIFARNFFTFKVTALTLAFTINFFLLLFRVSLLTFSLSMADLPTPTGYP